MNVNVNIILTLIYYFRLWSNELYVLLVTGCLVYRLDSAALNLSLTFSQYVSFNEQIHLLISY